MWSCRSLTAFANNSAGSLPLHLLTARMGHQEDLVHADVKRIAAESVDQLIDQGEDDLVDIGVERAPAPAVDALVVLGDLG